MSPDAERNLGPLPYGMNIRLTMDQRVFLQLVAEANEEKVSQALRRVIDEAIANVVEAGKTLEGLRTDTFGIIDSFTPDPAWEERYGGEDEHAA